MDIRDVYTRKQRVMMAVLIVAGFCAAVLLSSLPGPSPEPTNCYAACATSRQVLASDEDFTTP